MDLSFTDTEQLLADSVRGFVSRAATKEALVDLHSRHAACPPAWGAAMAAAGWLGLLVPIEVGGSEATAMQAAMFFQELGRAPLPPAWLLSSGVAAPLLSAASKSAAQSEILANIAAGTAVVVPGFQTAGTRWSGICPVEVASTLTTELVFVCGLTDASHVLVPVSLVGEGSFAAVPRDHPAVTHRRLTGFLSDSHVVTINELDLSSIQLVPCNFAEPAVGRALAIAVAMISAYQVGSCGRLLEISVAHANDRVQFGQLIGAFQRVQDHVVRIVNSLDAARWMLYDALATEPSTDQFQSKSWLARAAAADAHWECANATHEVLAGIGSDPAHGTVLHTAMSRLLHDVLGDPGWCRRRHAALEGW